MYCGSFSEPGLIRSGISDLVFNLDWAYCQNALGLDLAFFAMVFSCGFFPLACQPSDLVS